MQLCCAVLRTNPRLVWGERSSSPQSGDWVRLHLHPTSWGQATLGFAFGKMPVTGGTPCSVERSVSTDSLLAVLTPRPAFVLHELAERSSDVDVRRLAAQRR